MDCRPCRKQTRHILIRLTEKGGPVQAALGLLASALRLAIYAARRAPRAQGIWVVLDSAVLITEVMKRAFVISPVQCSVCDLPGLLPDRGLEWPNIRAGFGLNSKIFRKSEPVAIAIMATGAMRESFVLLTCPAGIVRNFETMGQPCGTACPDSAQIYNTMVEIIRP
jgi:hypothetical protein